MWGYFMLTESTLDYFDCLADSSGTYYMRGDPAMECWNYSDASPNLHTQWGPGSYCLSRHRMPCNSSETASYDAVSNICQALTRGCCRSHSLRCWPTPSGSCSCLSTSSGGIAWQGGVEKYP